MDQQPCPKDVAVLLLAFGGPGSLDEVEPFLKNIFSGRPVPAAITAQVCERYRAIGGRSPLLEITRRQARSLQDHLKRLGRSAEVFVGMRHWHPFIPDVLKAIETSGFGTVLYCVLSPFSSPAAIGGYEQLIRDSLARSRSSLKAVPVKSWHQSESYYAALSEKVSEGLAWFPLPRRSSLSVVFTAHSLPLNQVRNDPYVKELQTAIAAVARYLTLPTIRLAFQSRGRGPEEWLEPSLEQVVDSLISDGAKEVLIVPAGFVADHLEVLYDLDIVLRKSLEEVGIHFHRAPVLNDSALFIKALADAVLDAWPKQ